MTDRLRDDVRLFVDENLASMEDVDAILLLLNHPTRAWTAREVAAALGIPPETTDARLSFLAGRGLLACESGPTPCYRYVVSDDEGDGLLRELADACSSDRASVADVLEPRPHRNLIRRFAEAMGLARRVRMSG